jgi:tetratricopeptide (TPR) repeat protein
MVKYKIKSSQVELDSRRGRLLPSIPVSILILFVTAPVFADSIMIETDKEQYATGDIALVTGHVANRSMPMIAMLVFDPDGEILLVDSVDVQSDGMFVKTISLDSPFYDKTGLYLIAVEYIDDSAFTIIEVKSNTVQAPPPPKVVPKVVELKTEKKSYYDNEFVAITGAVSAISESTVLIGIYNPDGSPAGFYVVDIGSNLRFSTSFLAKDGINFKTVGKYSVKAHYANTALETTFDFLGLPPATQKPIQQESKNVPDEPKKVRTEPTTPQRQPQNTTPAEQPRTEPEQTDNLSIHDEELGRMLNDIMLNCDSSEFKDAIVYGNGMGPALMRLCKYEQAISYFDAMPNASNIIETYSNRGSALAKIGHYDAALDYYDAALDLDPDFAPALNNKANLMMQQGKISQAISMYDAALKSDPNNTVAKKNLEKAKIRQAELNRVETKLHSIEDSEIRQETSTDVDFALSEWKGLESTSTNIEAASHEPKEDFFEKITSVFSTIGAALGLWR